MIQQLRIHCSYISFNKLFPTSLLSFCFRIPGCLCFILSYGFCSMLFCPISSHHMDLKNPLVSVLWMWVWWIIVRIPYKEPVLDRELVQDNFIGRDLISCSITCTQGCGLGARAHGHLWETTSCFLTWRCKTCEGRSLSTFTSVHLHSIRTFT